MQRPWFWVVVSLVLGLLQAWDAGGFAMGRLVAVVTLAGLVFPIATIALRVPHGVRIGALALGAILLVVARLSSPVSLNGLHLALFPAAVYILVLRGLTFDGHQQSA